MKERIRLIEPSGRMFGKRTDRQDYFIKNVFETFMKLEEKKFGKNKFNFIKFAVYKRKGKARDIAQKIHEYITERCDGYSNNPQHVLEDWFECIFVALYRVNPDFYRLTPNSWTIGVFERFLWTEEKAEGESYFKKIRQTDYNETKHMQQEDNWMIDKRTGWILTDNDSHELMEV